MNRLGSGGSFAPLSIMIWAAEKRIDEHMKVETNNEDESATEAEKTSARVQRNDRIDQWNEMKLRMNSSAYLPICVFPAFSKKTY